ncbi:hypothetical protein [Candidatus Stoquefichus massiliensis]|uniref:hypothetical protein n=1 Tax=Candidatus Stoquefichus massiliensis TaxID=1470350 RepID=UPI0004812854|nr:hypothetical protein [Candidatus Stoquefichus massiliensis]
MEWKDIYLDKEVDACIVIKTLSKQKIMDSIHYLYKGNLVIEETDLLMYKNCLVIKIEPQRFLDYVDLYKQIMRISGHRESLQTIMKIRNTMVDAYRTRLDAVMIGTTQWSESFLLKMNIRNCQSVLDIYFENGNSYYEDAADIVRIDENNLYAKVIKKYSMEEKR